MQPLSNPKPRFPAISCRAALAGALLAAVGLSAAGTVRAAQDGGASWSPASSERLIKLPASYLKKAVDRDWNRWEFGP